MSERVDLPDRPKGEVRSEPWLSLEDDHQQIRNLIARLARQTFSCVVVGNPAPIVAERFERMTHPQPGDLVVEMSSLRRAEVDHRSVGYLLEVRVEFPWPAERDSYEHVWYVQYGPSPEDVCRWNNADFIAVDVTP